MIHLNAINAERFSGTVILKGKPSQKPEAINDHVMASFDHTAGDLAGSAPGDYVVVTSRQEDKLKAWAAQTNLPFMYVTNTIAKSSFKDAALRLARAMNFYR